jgi:5-formyltetrahydrofolate cyclo-ligase
VTSLNLWVQGQFGSGISGLLFFIFIRASMIDYSVNPLSTTPLSAEDMTRAQLRQTLRRRRCALSPSQQSEASVKALRYLLKLPQLMRAQHVALYMANDGELNPQLIAEQLWKMKKQVYLPVLRIKQREMWFVHYTPGTELFPNSHGIAEPDHRRLRKLLPSLLDVVLLPLVGFDSGGARLGMGGGYYDATFAFKHKKPKGRPYLIGLAHSCQEVSKLAVAAWDIPLFAVVTDRAALVIAES